MDGPQKRGFDSPPPDLLSHHEINQPPRHVDGAGINAPSILAQHPKTLWRVGLALEQHREKSLVLRHSRSICEDQTNQGDNGETWNPYACFAQKSVRRRCAPLHVYEVRDRPPRGVPLPHKTWHSRHGLLQLLHARIESERLPPQWPRWISQETAKFFPSRYLCAIACWRMFRSKGPPSSPFHSASRMR